MWFETKAQMIDFVKKGNIYLKPKDIKVKYCAKLEPLSNDIFK